MFGFEVFFGTPWRCRLALPIAAAHSLVSLASQNMVSDFFLIKVTKHFDRSKLQPVEFED
jgi:hypothetical protein